MSWIAGSHHVFSIKHLLSQFWNCQRSVLLTTTRCQWSKSGHEEMQTGEWNHIDRQFSQICVQLTGEPIKNIVNWKHDFSNAWQQDFLKKFSSNIKKSLKISSNDEILKRTDFFKKLPEASGNTRHGQRN